MKKRNKRPTRPAILLPVGLDGRNRTVHWPFASRTGRTQPSTTQFAFNAPGWMRGLIKPEPGRAIAYIDWKAAEFGIAAILSEDETMRLVYESKDPYLEFAIRAGAAPKGATRPEYDGVRETFKVVVLAVGYGQGARGLAEQLGVSIAYGRELLQRHRNVFPTYWRWSKNVAATAMLNGSLETQFGWPTHTRFPVVGDDFGMYAQSLAKEDRSLRNFAVQATCADMMKLACVFAIDDGITVCACVHDAICVESTIHEISDVVARTQDAMARASRACLDGFELKTDVDVVRYPDRYRGKGAETWDEIMRIVGLE